MKYIDPVMSRRSLGRDGRSSFGGAGRRSDSRFFLKHKGRESQGTFTDDLSVKPHRAPVLDKP